MVPAIFLDKDGTLIPDIFYNVDLDRITLSDGAEIALDRSTIPATNSLSFPINLALHEITSQKSHLQELSNA